MKKPLSVLMLAVLPGLALAGGGHGGSDHSHAGHHLAPMAGTAAVSASGQAGDPAKVSRTIAVTMADTMRFTPEQITVKAGETIRFTVNNTGKMPHEMVLGTVDELREHAALMREMPGMQHAEANMVRLDPGQSGDLVWQFDKAGAVDFACLVPGHYEAGMKGSVRIE